MKMRGHSSLLSIYWLSTAVTVVLVATVGFGLGLSALATMLTLSILEITFSFDNAVVNASVLQRMSVFWQRMFLTVGILIGVFGVRMALPVVLVAVSAHLGFVDVMNLAINNPAQYAHDLQAAHATIAAFGGAFLLMIFLDYLANQDWVSRRMSKREARWFRLAPVLATLAVVGGVYAIAPAAEQTTVLVAGLVGVAVYLAVHVLSGLFSHPSAGNVVRTGFFTFLYLELLDASFSFDGVIGAFAITSNVLLITAGLGLGAVWVRSMTIHLVRRKVLQRYQYLDAGAHVAILALSATLFIGISFDIPGALTGLTGLLIVGLAFVASVVRNRRLARRQ